MKKIIKNTTLSLLNISTFEDIRVRIGGSSTLQFQALDHENGVDQALIDGGTVQPLQEIGSNFNLATANQLAACCQDNRYQCEDYKGEHQTAENYGLHIFVFLRLKLNA